MTARNSIGLKLKLHSLYNFTTKPDELQQPSQNHDGFYFPSAAGCQKAGGRYECQLHDRGHETEEPEDRLQHQEGQGQEGGGGQALVLLLHGQQGSGESQLGAVHILCQAKIGGSRKREISTEHLKFYNKIMSYPKKSRYLQNNFFFLCNILVVSHHIDYIEMQLETADKFPSLLPPLCPHHTAVQKCTV